MSEKSFEPIESLSVDMSEKVAGLSDRPNQTGVYGASGLSAQQLKAHFDLYSDKIAEKVNEIIEKLSTGTGDYLSIGENISLYDLVASFEDGSWAGKFQIEQTDSTKTNLLAFLNGLIASISALQEDGSVTTQKIKDQAVTSEKIDGVLLNDLRKSFSNVIFTKDSKTFTFYRNDGKDDTWIALSLQGMVFEEQLGDFINSIAYDKEAYKLTFKTKGGQSTEVDLPIESLVLSVTYVSDTKSLKVTLKSGDTVDVPLNDVITGLVVSTENIANEAVTTAKIENSAVTSEKIKDLSVTRDKIIGGAISLEHLESLVVGSLLESFSEVSYDKLTGALDFKNNDGKYVTIHLPLNELEKRVEILEGLTLTKVTDDTVAYEKVVPADVGSRAAINKVGGFSRKVLANNNHCSADDVYECSGETAEIELGDLSHLNDGMYYLSINAPNGFHRMELEARGSDFFVSSDGGTSSLTFQYDKKDFDGLTFYLTLISEWYEYGEEGARELSGTANNFMLCLDSDEDKSYKPYEEMFVEVKPTHIESRGANLCDLTRAKLTNCILQSNGDVKSNIIDKRYCSADITYLNEILPINKGKYLTFSVNKPVGNTNYISIIIYGEFSNGATFAEAQTHTNTVTTQIPDTLISVSKMELRVNGSSNVETDTTSVFSNYMLNWGNTPASYKPFSAEPIDTFEIPEAIRNLPDYGMDGCYIDFDRKVWVGAGGAETSIAQYLPSYKKYFYMDVQPGGTFRFINDGSNDVPSTVTYVKKL